MVVSLFVGKLLTTISLVLGLSWVAERVDTRTAGILSGMPLGALLVLGFVGHDLGPGFAGEAALYAIPSIAGTLVFTCFYYLISRWDHPLSPLAASVIGIIGYFCVALILNQLTFSRVSATSVAIISIVIAKRVLEKIATEKVSTRVLMTFRHLVFRAGLAAVFVIIITGVAHFVGPQWSGILIGFPMTFLPLLLVIQITYSNRHAHSIIRSFPLGLGGLLIFLSIASHYLPILGTNQGILLSLAGSFVYLAFIGYLLNRQTRRQTSGAGVDGEP